MSTAKIDSLLISPQKTILETMAIIEDAPPRSGISGIAIVVDNDRHLLGVVTDGDIRSAILHNLTLDTRVEKIMSRTPFAVVQHPSAQKMYEALLDMLKGSTRMLDRGAGKIVVVDDERRVVDVVSFFSLMQQSDIKSRKIAVLGLGFVGLTLAVVLADSGFNVLGVEAQADVVEMLRKGTPHFYETGLSNQLRAHIGNRLKVENVLSDKDCDIHIVSVGTPVNSNHAPVMTYVEEACRSIGRVLKSGDTVMMRSTVPVGTTRNVCLPILEKESGLLGGKDFSLVFAPERTIAGKALKELRALPQVIGALDPQGAEVAAAVYRELSPTIVILDSLEEAEMVKLVNNTFRDTIFSFANEIALVCEKYNLDAATVINAANEGYPRDPVPLPSPGVGGVCLKKDPYLLQASAQAKGFAPHILGRSRLVNEYMPSHIFQKYVRFCEANGRLVAGSKVFIAGFAFKGWPETSDMRDSATLELAKLLQQSGAEVFGYDPVVAPDALNTIPGVRACSVEDGFSGASCIFIMNNHPSYEDWNLLNLLASMEKPGLFVDGWSMYRTEDIVGAEGISYSSVSKDQWKQV